MGVPDVARLALCAVVLIDRQHDPISLRRMKVVVFVPHQDDRGPAPVVPAGGGVDRADDALNRLIAGLHQSRIKTALCAVIVWIEVAESSAVGTAMLIVALVRDDEGQAWNVPGAEISIELVKTDLFLQRCRCLTALEIDEGVMFRSIKRDDVRGGQGWLQDWLYLGKVGLVGIFPVADADAVRAGDRQAFLIAL